MSFFNMHNFEFFLNIFLLAKAKNEKVYKNNITDL